MKITLRYKVNFIEDVVANRYGITCRSQMFRIHSMPEIDYFSADPTDYSPTFKITTIESFACSYGPMGYESFHNEIFRKNAIYYNLEKITKMIRHELEAQEIDRDITGID